LLGSWSAAEKREVHLWVPIGTLVESCGAMRWAGLVIGFVALSGVVLASPVEQGCTYTVSPLTLSIPGSGGTGQVNVTTGAGCSWTAAATSGTSWLSLTSGGGVGSGAVSWVAAPNTLPTQRLGSLSIAGRSIFVVQLQPSAPPTPTSAAPGAPRQLAAAVSGSSLTLTWSPPESGGAPTTYVIAAGSASGWSNLASFATGNTLTSFSAGAVPNGAYFVRVSAQNAMGTRGSSNEVSFAVPQACTSAPPSALQSSVNGAVVTLTWAAPSDGVTPTAYQLEVGSGVGLANLGTFSTGSPATTFSGTAAPGSYFVRVRAVTACGITPPTEDVGIVVRPV
jgi:hypothetical protein